MLNKELNLNGIMKLNNNNNNKHLFIFFMIDNTLTNIYIWNFIHVGEIQSRKFETFEKMQPIFEIEISLTKSNSKSKFEIKIRNQIQNKNKNKIKIKMIKVKLKIEIYIKSNNQVQYKHFIKD